jgi:hypothetical protein
MYVLTDGHVEPGAVTVSADDDLMAASARYLGLDVPELRRQLERTGVSLGELAWTRGRSIDGLFDALLERVERDLPAELPREVLLRAVERTIVDRSPVGARDPYSASVKVDSTGTPPRSVLSTTQ